MPHDACASGAPAPPPEASGAAEDAGDELLPLPLHLNVNKIVRQVPPPSRSPLTLSPSHTRPPGSPPFSGSALDLPRAPPPPPPPGRSSGRTSASTTAYAASTPTPPSSTPPAPATPRSPPSRTCAAASGTSGSPRRPSPATSRCAARACPGGGCRCCARACLLLAVTIPFYLVSFRRASGPLTHTNLHYF